MGKVSQKSLSLRIFIALVFYTDENFDEVTRSQAGIPVSGYVNARSKPVYCRVRDSELSRTKVNILTTNKCTILTNLKKTRVEIDG